MPFGQCHAEEIYVRTSTGERFFGEDYIRSGGTPMDLFHELAHGTVVHEDEWLKKHPPEEEPDEGIRKLRLEESEQPAVQPDRTPERSEGDLPVRQGSRAESGAPTQQVKPKREVRYMCCLVVAAVVFTCLWLLYY